MRHGFRKGLLCIKKIAGKIIAILYRSRGSEPVQVGAQSVSEHDLRDVGLLDGRVSPSTAERRAGPRIRHDVDAPPHWL